MKLTYKDVVRCHSYLGHIDRMYELAVALGYPYFLWNDHVYEILYDIGDRRILDTGMTVSDIE